MIIYENNFLTFGKNPTFFQKINLTIENNYKCKWRFFKKVSQNNSIQ